MKALTCLEVIAIGPEPRSTRIPPTHAPCGFTLDQDYIPNDQGELTLHADEPVYPTG